MPARVGTEAVDFESTAYIEGAGFQNVKLSDYKGKWIVLCFYPAVQDAGGKVGQIYGIYDEAAGVDIRGRFIIDPSFVIRAMEVLTPEVGRNPVELLRQVKALQHVVATGEVTPLGWEPGKPTLKPGPALVGRVWEVWKP